MDSERDAETRTQAPSPSHQAPPLDGYGALAPARTRDRSRYQILTEHGRGGLGRVLRAHDRELRRTVAIKETLSRSREDEIRFFREALITAQLEHPGIVPVHEAGRWPDGTPFYSMKLVAGSPMSERLGTTSRLDERLSLLPNLLAVADAISYAHARGIIHRDLKPSNIIVGDFGETVVIDWGLARRVDGTRDPDAATAVAPEDPFLTAAGTILGTPAYMAPEQASGDRVDHRADVYALGAILFHLLHGHPPSVSSSKNADAPVELEAITRRAMAASPDERYGSAARFAADLRRYVGGSLVEAHVYRRKDRLLRWARLNAAPLAVALVAMVALLTLLSVAVTRIVWARNAATRQRVIAEERAAALAHEKALAEQRTTDLVIAHAMRLASDDPAAAMALLAENVDAIVNRPEIPRLITDLVHAGLPDWILPVSDAAVIALSPDASRLAIHDSSGLMVVDTTTRVVVRQWNNPLWTGIQRDLYWADDHHVAAKAIDSVVYIYDVEDGSATPITPWCGESPFHSDGTGTVAAVCTHGMVYVCHVETAAIARYEVPKASLVAVADASAVIVGYPTGQIGIIRPDGMRNIAVDTNAILALDVSPSHDRVLVGTLGGRLSVVDLNTGTARRVAEWPDGAVYQVGWVDGTRVIVAARDHRIAIVDVRTGDRLVELVGMKFRISRDYIAVADNQRIQLVSRGAPWSATLRAHGGEVDWMTSADGAFASTSADSTVRFWRRIPAPKSFIPYTGVSAEIAQVPAIDGIAFMSSEGSASVCAKGHCAQVYTAGPGARLRTGDAETLAIIADDPGRVVISDLGGAKQTTLLTEPTAADARLSNDRLAIGSGTALLFAERAGTTTVTRAPPECDRIRGLAWHASGDLLVRCRRAVYRAAGSSTWTRLPWRFDTEVYSVAALADESILISTMPGSTWLLPHDSDVPLLVRLCLRDASPFFASGAGAVFVCDGELVSIQPGGGHETLSREIARTILWLNAASNSQIAVSTVEGGLLWDRENDRISIVPLDVGVDRMGSNSTSVFVAARPGLIEVWDRASLRDIPTDPGALPAWLVRSTRPLHAAIARGFPNSFQDRSNK